jgi:hypothetical protein
MDNILEKLNLVELQDSLFEMAQNLLSGKPIEKSNYTVTIELPTILAKTIEGLAKQLNIEATEVLNKMASDGVIQSLKSALSIYGIKPNEEELNKQASTIKDHLGIDFSDMIGGLEKVKKLGEELAKIEKVIKNAGISIKSKAE